MKLEKKILIFVLIFSVIVKFALGLPLDGRLPGGTDTSSHLFKAWYMSEYGVTKWNYYWYGGFTFLTHYPPLSHLVAGGLGKLIDYLFAYNLLNNLLIAISPLIFYIFLKSFNLKTKEIIVALIFFSFMPIYSYYLADGRFPVLMILVLGLAYWTTLKKAIDSEKFKYILLSGIILGLSILVHHLTAAVLAVITFFWAISYKFNTKTIFSFIKIALISFLLSIWWTIPYLYETVGSNYQGEFIESPNPAALEENLISRFISFKFFVLPFSAEILLIFVAISGCLILVSLFDWKNKLTRDFIITAIFTIIALLVITYKRTFVFLPIPLSILVAKGLFKLNSNIVKIVIPIFVIFAVTTYISIMPQSFPNPEFPVIPKDGRVLFIPLSDGFQENENEVKGFYSVMLSPMHGNENIYGWHIQSQMIGEAGLKKMQYYDLLGQPLTLDGEKYYELLKNSWVNYIVLNKKEGELINYFYKGANFRIFNETQKFVIFEVVPKASYVAINGKDVEANFSKETDKISINTICEKGIVEIKESYHKNWKGRINGNLVDLDTNDYGFLKLESNESGACSIELTFEYPNFYFALNAVSFIGWLVAFAYLMRRS